MEQHFEQLVQALSLGEKTDAEWWAEQYEIECAAALAIKSAEPFSETRTRITQKAYETVNKLICAHDCQNNVITTAYGASAYCVDLIEQLLQCLQKKKQHVRFFEAGVGGGTFYPLCGIVPMFRSTVVTFIWIVTCLEIWQTAV